MVHLRLLPLLILMLLTGRLYAQQGDFSWLTGSPKTTVETVSGPIPVLAFEELEPLFHQEGTQVRIINFWATWCAPCIAELPFFEKIRREYADRGVEVTLVSLDMPSMWEKRLPAFIEKRGIESPVVVLDDPRQNDWIPRVSQEWSGAIPATLIYSANRREFYEQTFDGPQLESVVQSFLND
ncbi:MULTISPECIES: TlpA family protein disulfide reductase [Robiginitalea]|uniref:TlpA family protein disulfide reductase n=1 Tax=Robiginitalea TaxID=252306 RepID=UPI0023496F96|nr:MULTISPECIES: TlpA family protein disulfide reductase [unclassified Robiginitalea]MDC6354714.1 TlpA family protein disulfide reductase [Robiginitalea sp. PM2]MDC6374604.1 TlpA family protein disulfide reductase [Robiginitalea sp. SP8]